VRRKPAGAEIVLRVDVGRREIELRRPAHLLHLAHDRLAIARAEPRIDHEGRARPDDNADVRHHPDVVIGDDVDVIGDLDGGVLANERRRPARTALRGGKSRNEHGGEGGESKAVLHGRGF
jgi:hypothetical protein